MIKLETLNSIKGLLNIQIVDHQTHKQTDEQISKYLSPLSLRNKLNNSNN